MRVALAHGDEARAELDTFSTQRQGCRESAPIGDATARQHGNAHRVYNARSEHHRSNIVASQVAAALEANGDHRVGTQRLRLARRPLASHQYHCAHRHSAALNTPQKWLGIAAGDADDRRSLLQRGVDEGVQGRMPDGEIDAEGLSGQALSLLDIRLEFFGSGETGAPDLPQAARVRDCGSQFGEGEMRQATLHDWIADLHKFGEARMHLRWYRCCQWNPLFFFYCTQNVFHYG